MTYYQIFENGFVSTITASNYADACDTADQNTINEDGNFILIEKKIARKVATSILKPNKGGKSL
jgi:hypothetical protein